MSKPERAILDLPPRIVERNLKLNEALKAAVGSDAAVPAASDSLGTVHNGVNRVYASIGKERGGFRSANEIEICLLFDAYVSSVSIQSFNRFRSVLTDLIGSEKVLQIDADADTPAGAQDGSTMERFAAQLFSRMFGGDFTLAQRDFSTADCASGAWKCADVVQAIRKLTPQVLHFSGALHVKGPPDIPKRMVASIPVTTISFHSGYVVPFTGYSGPIVCEEVGRPAARRMPFRIVLPAGELLSCLA